MSPPHVFVDPADCTADRVSLRGPVAHHLLRVLRRRRGDRLSVADGTGAVRAAVVVRVDGDRAEARVTGLSHVAAPTPALRVVCGLPKRRKLDEVVQRLTELGVDEIVPAVTDRTQVQLHGDRADKACARWRAVARAAAEQSRRARLPRIAPVTAWADAFADVAAGVVCWEEADTPLHAVPLGVGDGTVAVGVGPEGGLTPKEVMAAGVPAVALGPTILRAETAAVVAPSLVLHRIGRLA